MRVYLMQTAEDVDACQSVKFAARFLRNRTMPTRVFTEGGAIVPADEVIRHLEGGFKIFGFDAFGRRIVVKPMELAE